MTALWRDIVALIEAEGPIGVDRYMALCLSHPLHGYYMTRDPLGRAGDFTTAPEISQMFGELLGLWAAEVWTEMGRPDTFRLVELGPGRGTLMADALRALRVVPACRQAASVHLVETSPVLRAVQRERLADVAVTWHAAIDELPEGPAIVLANEFLDALPARQFVRGRTGWHERHVGLDGEGHLVFGLTAEPLRGPSLSAREGELVEVGEAAAGVGRSLAERLRLQGGAALFLDYGHSRSALGETLQAVHRHRFADPLAEPGEADLTVHVDFAAFGREATTVGVNVHGPLEQGVFLGNLGIQARAAALSRGRDPAQVAGIAAALERLTGTEPGQMGALFKVIGLSHPDLSQLPGLPLRFRPDHGAASERHHADRSA